MDQRLAIQEQEYNPLFWRVHHLSQKVTTEKKAAYSCCLTTLAAVKFTHSNPNNQIYRNNFVL